MSLKSIIALGIISTFLFVGAPHAQVSISSLPAASTPLDGSEIVPIVQGGITKKVSAAGLLTQPSNLGVVNEIGTYTLLSGYWYQRANIQTFPATGNGMAAGWNYTNGSFEADFWNTYVSTPPAISFDFRQLTSPTSFTDILQLGTSKSTFLGPLILNSSFARTAPQTIITSTYTVGANDNYIICTNATGCAMTLPAAVSFSGRVLNFKTTGGGAITSASSNVVPLAGGAAGTSVTAATAGKWANLVSDGSNWIIMEGN